LRQYLWRSGREPSPLCECGSESESVGHFLLRCPLHEQSLRRLMRSVLLASSVVTQSVTEDILLGSTSLRDDQRLAVGSAVCRFVRDTQRGHSWVF